MPVGSWSSWFESARRVVFCQLGLFVEESSDLDGTKVQEKRRRTLQNMKVNRNQDMLYREKKE